jgi:hypothetical protein
MLIAILVLVSEFNFIAAHRDPGCRAASDASSADIDNQYCSTALQSE